MSIVTGILLAGLAGLSVALVFLPRPPVEEVARLRQWVYRSIILAEWWLLALFLALLLADGRPPARFGLRVEANAWREDLLWAGGVTLAAIALGKLWWDLGRRHGWAGLDFMRALLPRTPREKWLALALALTAGLCEEFLYRGFLITVVREALGSEVLAGGVSVLLFGLAHAPYGRLGLLSALGGGVVLAVAFLATGRLTAPILAHIAYDSYAFFLARFEATDGQG